MRLTVGLGMPLALLPSHPAVALLGLSASLNLASLLRPGSPLQEICSGEAPERGRLRDLR